MELTTFGWVIVFLGGFGLGMAGLLWWVGHVNPPYERETPAHFRRHRGERRKRGRFLP